MHNVLESFIIKLFMKSNTWSSVLKEKETQGFTSEQSASACMNQ